VKGDLARYAKDIEGQADEKVRGEPLLIKVMERGTMTCDLPSLSETRERTLRDLSLLPSRYKKLRTAPRYPVEFSPMLKEIKKTLANQLKKREDLLRHKF
jgi:hypothetical protein